MVRSWHVAVGKLAGLLFKSRKNFAGRNARTGIHAGMDFTLEFPPPLQQAHCLIQQLAAALIHSRFQLMLNELLVPATPEIAKKGLAPIVGENRVFD